MQIQVIKDAPVFKPVVIQITLESQEEVIRLEDLSKLNVSIPDVVGRALDGETKDFSFKFLGLLEKAMAGV